MLDVVNECVAILGRINSQGSKLESELTRRACAEAVQVRGRVEPRDEADEWPLSVDEMIAQQLRQYNAVLGRLAQQNQRVDRTLSKMRAARPALGWHIQEIDELLAQLASRGIEVSAHDMSMHLWESMLDKLRAKNRGP